MADEKKNVPMPDEELAEVAGGDPGYRWFDASGEAIHCRECGQSDKIKYRYDFFKKIYCCTRCNIEFKDEESFHTSTGSF